MVIEHGTVRKNHLKQTNLDKALFAGEGGIGGGPLEFEVFNHIWKAEYVGSILSGQIIVFHQPGFSWNSQGFPLLNHHLSHEKTLLLSIILAG